MYRDWHDWGDRMALWVLACLNCKRDIEQAKINDRVLLDYLEPRKPIFPEEGLEVRCPNCGHRSVYRRNEMVYRV
jgi:DNA-directed RNA polymerase subunit RPC12/RpoP